MQFVTPNFTLQPVLTFVFAAGILNKTFQEEDPMDNKKALVGMSGGVDSSVAAYLMLRQGYECTGVTMRLYDSPTEDSTCCSLDDVEDARAVAARLGIRHYTFNFKDDFYIYKVRREFRLWQNLQS